MAKKSTKKSGAAPKKPAAKKPAKKGLAIPQAAVAAIRDSFVKSNEAGLSHHKLRKEFLAFEKQALETQQVHDRDFKLRVEEAAKALGIDPAKHTVNLQTMTFEPRR